MTPSPSGTDRNRDSSGERDATPTTSASTGSTLPQSQELLAAASSTSLAGTTLSGRYQVQRLIARGGMGAVYEAHDSALDRRVALKTVHLGHELPPDAMQRFRREALAAAQLDHPNIVAVYDFQDDRGLQFFTMALVDGPSLTQFVRERGPLPPADAVALMLPIIDAVGFAHGRKFIHRDLKPDNVLLDSHGRPRVTDFGLARHLLDESHLTGTGQLLGTPRYMAPEQARNQQSSIGPATDVYALGGILGFLLTGRPPIAGENVAETLINLIEGEPSLPRDANPQVPAALNEICRRCLAKNPADRFASTAELSAALRAFLAGDPIPVESGPSGSNRKWIVAVAAIVVIACGVGGWALFGGGKPAVSSSLPKTVPPVVPSASEVKPSPKPKMGAMSPRVQALVNQLKDESAEVRGSAAEALGSRGPDARLAIPAIVERIRDDVWTTGVGISRDNSTNNSSKDAAVAALQAIAPADVEGAVVGATESKNARVRAWAARKLGTIGKSSAPDEPTPTRRVAALAGRLKDVDSYTRYAAANSLGELGDEAKPAVPALIERIRDEVWSVGDLSQDNSSTNSSKDAALAALKKLAPDKVEAALVAAAAAKNSKVKVWANSKLAKPDD